MGGMRSHCPGGWLCAQAHLPWCRLLSALLSLCPLMGEDGLSDPRCPQMSEVPGGQGKDFRVGRALASLRSGPCLGSETVSSSLVHLQRDCMYLSVGMSSQQPSQLAPVASRALRDREPGQAMRDVSVLASVSAAAQAEYLALGRIFQVSEDRSQRPQLCFTVLSRHP